MTTEIELKDAKCTKLSIQVPVTLARDEKNNADFVIEAYTGAVVDRWWGKLAIDIDGIQAKNNIPVFRDHMRGNIVGYSNKTWKDGSFWVSGNFSKVTQHADEVKALAAEGFPWQASIGVRALKILSIEEGASHKVNGKKLEGPAEVWLQSQVFETSFVPLGGDADTSVAVFSFEETAQPQPVGDDPPERKDEMAQEKTPVVLTIDSLRADHPEIAKELLAEGATAERERIQAVLAQAMPGHEDLIQTMAFDGKTTGPEAAVAVLAAEKKIRSTAKENLDQDGQDPTNFTATPEVQASETAESENDNRPLEERAKAQWDKDAKLRNEFDGDYDAYLAFEKAVEAGSVKRFGKK